MDRLHPLLQLAREIRTLVDTREFNRRGRELEGRAAKGVRRSRSSPSRSVSARLYRNGRPLLMTSTAISSAPSAARPAQLTTNPFSQQTLTVSPAGARKRSALVYLKSFCQRM